MSQRTLILLSIGLLLLAIILAGGYFYLEYQKTAQDNIPSELAQIDDEPELVYNRNFESEIEEFEASFSEENIDQTLGDEFYEENAIARAKLRAAKHYLGKRDLENMLKAVELLQESITQEGPVEVMVRAKAYQNLGALYAKSGGDPRVFDAIFSGEFEEYGGNGDAREAQMLLSQKAYETYPAARFAIDIALYHSKNALDTRSSDDITEAVTWLQIADGLADVGVYEGRFGYLFWRVNVLGNLTLVDTGRFYERFHDSYDDVVSYLNRRGYAHPGHVDGQSLPFIYLHYARIVNDIEGEGNRELVHTTLQKLIDFVESDSNKDQNEFVVFLRAQQLKSEPDLLANDISALAGVYGPFTEFLQAYDYEL